ncbi:MAG: extracellular solute-binding protein, partial [Pseudomonadota bacterium]
MLSRPARAAAFALAVACTAAAWTASTGPAAASSDAAADAAAVETTVSHGISSFGDLKYPEGFPHFDYVNPDAPKGGVWSGRGTAASNTFDSLHPFILKGEPAQGLGATFDTLLTGSADEADALYGLLAETLEYPEGRAWVRFTLRPEAAFSDGSPVTAQDVAWTFETLKTRGSPLYRLRLRDVASATAEDARTVRFDFAEGVPTRDLPALVGALPILSEASWQGRDFEDSTLDPILGSGPYAVTDVKPGRSITYTRREDYWAKDLNVNVGTNNFDAYRYEYFKDYTAAFEGFKAGAFHMHEEFFSKIWATGYDFPAVNNGWVIRESVPDGRPSGAQGFWFNMRRPQFQDPRVREALAMGFDFEWSNEVLFFGLYARTDSVFENSPLQAEGPPSPEELALLEPLAADLPPGVLSDPPYSPPVSNGSGSDRRVLRRAMRLLDEAGWPVGDD